MGTKLFLISLVCCLSVFACKKEKTGRSVIDEYNTVVHKKIKKHVDDDERKNRLLALHSKSQLKQIEVSFIFSEMGVKMRSNPSMTKEEADALLAEAAEKRAQLFRELASIKIEMRSLATKEEWQQIFVKSAEPAAEAGKEKAK